MLIPCKDCGKQISSEASACPNCGCPVAESKKAYVDMQKYRREKKTKADTTSAIIMVITLLAIVVLLIWNELSGDNKDKDNNKPTKTVSNTKTPTPTPIPLTEEQYKNSCNRYYYEDVFFGEENLIGKFVELDLFLTEKMIFEVDDAQNSEYQQFYKKYKMQRDFFKCSVLHKEEDSYVGPGKIQIWFSDKNSLNAEDYKTGEKIIVYGEVISWSDNTMDGYNSIIVIPKYIEYK